MRHECRRFISTESAFDSNTGISSSEGFDSSLYTYKSSPSSAYMNNRFEKHTLSHLRILVTIDITSRELIRLETEDKN